MKATFSITLLHENGTVALSNGRQNGGFLSCVATTAWQEAVPLTCHVISPDSEPFTQDGETVLRTVFEETPKMSTYLLAFIVSEFAFINQTSSKGVGVIKSTFSCLVTQ